MKIALSEIKGLDHRVRQQMNPEKLEELADSIKELGQIVPVKVPGSAKIVIESAAPVPLTVIEVTPASSVYLTSSVAGLA